MLNINNEKNRIRRSLEGDINIAFKDAALKGVKSLDYLWQHADEGQRRRILEGDNLAALFKSITLHITSRLNENNEEVIEEAPDDHIDLDQDLQERRYSLQDLYDTFKWFNKYADNDQRRKVYSAIFEDIINFFISKNDTEGLDLIKQSISSEAWNDKFKVRNYSNLDVFMSTIMSLENSKVMLSWFKVNLRNLEMTQSIDRIIDILNQMPTMKKKAEELKRRSSDTERLTNVIVRINDNPTQENIAELLQTISTVSDAAEKGDIETLTEYQKTLIERPRVNNHKIANVKSIIADALRQHYQFIQKYKSNLSKLTNHLKPLVALLNKERNIKARLDEVMSNTGDYSVVQTSKVTESCVQELSEIFREFNDIKGSVSRSIGLHKDIPPHSVQATLKISLSSIFNKILKKIEILGSLRGFVDELNQNFKLVKGEHIKLNIDLVNLYSKLAQNLGNLEEKSPSDLLKLRDLVSGEYTSTIERLHLMQSMLSDLRFVLSEKPIVDQQYRDCTAKVIKKLELQLKTFDEIKLKFYDVLEFTDVKQIEQNHDDFTAKIRTLKQNLKLINKQDLLKEAIKNDSFDSIQSLIKNGVVIDDEVVELVKEHGSAEISAYIDLESFKQKLSTIRNKILDAFDGCSESKKRRKRQPCDYSDLEKEAVDFLKSQVNMILKRYVSIDSTIKDLNTGNILDFEGCIYALKKLSRNLSDFIIEQNDILQEYEQDIMDSEVSIDNMQKRLMDARIYENNANGISFDELFSELEGITDLF